MQEDENSNENTINQTENITGENTNKHENILPNSEPI